MTANIEIGSLGTVSIGSDNYAVKVVRKTAKTLTVEYLYGGQKGSTKIFRNCGGVWSYKSHYILTLGEARQEMDPGF